jgi:hypothetical protein
MRSKLHKTKFQWLKPHVWDMFLMTVVAGVGLLAGWWVRDIIADDAMITFRVAENLAAGRGFVFNPGEYVQVTTTPLYAILLAAGSWFVGTAPAAAQILNIALSAINPVLAYDIGRRLSGRLTGVSAALILVLMPPLIIAFSMESYLYVFLILASLDAYAARRWRLAGVMVGITAVLRGDAALMGACLVTYDVLAYRRLRWRLIVPAAVIPAGWYLFAMLYYGSPFPATLQAKVAQGEFNWLGEHFISGFLEYWESWIIEDYYHPELYLIPALYLLGLIPVIQRERTWLIIIGRDLLYIMAFELLRVTFAEWYYAPVTAGVALMAGRGVQVVADTVARFIPNPRLKIGTAVGISGAIILILWNAMYPISNDIVAANPDWKARAYPPAARWIVKNTNPSASLATIDIGHLGYYTQRHIIDIVGLAQPDVAPHIAQGDFGYAIRRYEPDLLLLGATWLAEVQSQPWFQQAYALRHSLRPTGIAEPLYLFSRRSGVKVQPDPPPASSVQPLDVDFNRQIALTGYQINQPVEAGNRLYLTLFWQARAPIDLNFTVFVQLVGDGDDSTILAQGDSQPQKGFYQTSDWRPEEVIIDQYTIELPPEIDNGAYNLLVGLYDQNGARLQILDEAGQFAGDHVRLPGVIITH